MTRRSKRRRIRRRRSKGRTRKKGSNSRRSNCRVSMRRRNNIWSVKDSDLSPTVEGGVQEQRVVEGEREGAASIGKEEKERAEVRKGRLEED